MQCMVFALTFIKNKQLQQHR